LRPSWPARDDTAKLDATKRALAGGDNGEFFARQYDTALRVFAEREDESPTSP